MGRRHQRSRPIGVAPVPQRLAFQHPLIIALTTSSALLCTTLRVRVQRTARFQAECPIRTAAGGASEGKKEAPQRASRDDVPLPIRDRSSPGAPECVPYPGTGGTRKPDGEGPLFWTCGTTARPPVVLTKESPSSAGFVWSLSPAGAERPSRDPVSGSPMTWGQSKPIRHGCGGKPWQVERP